MSYLNQIQINEIKKIKICFLFASFFYGTIMPIFMTLFLTLIYSVDGKNVTQYYVIATILIFIVSVICFFLLPTIVNWKQLRKYRQNIFYCRFAQFIFGFPKAKKYQDENFQYEYYIFLFKFITHVLLMLVFFSLIFILYFFFVLLLLNFSFYSILFLITMFLITIFSILTFGFILFKLNKKIKSN